MKVGTGFIWLRIRNNGPAIVNVIMNLRFFKIRIVGGGVQMDPLDMSATE
jgi:hypothetical protein